MRGYGDEQVDCCVGRGVPLSTHHPGAATVAGLRARRSVWIRTERFEVRSWWLVSPGVARASACIKLDRLVDALSYWFLWKRKRLGCAARRLSEVCRGYRTQLWSARKPQAGLNW